MVVVTEGQCGCECAHCAAAAAAANTAQSQSRSQSQSQHTATTTQPRPQPQQRGQRGKEEEEGGLVSTLALCQCPHRTAEKCCGAVELELTEHQVVGTGEGEAVQSGFCVDASDDAPQQPAAEGEAGAGDVQVLEQAVPAAAAGACCTPSTNSADPSQKGGTWLVSLATGMVTSGCCLLQLGLNLLPAFSSSGCFGFNTHLKKLRPIFAAGTALWFARWAWRDFGPGRAPPTTEEERRSRRATAWWFVLTAAASLLISISPEIIALISRRR